MRVLLVNPLLPSKSLYLTPPLGLGYIGSYLQAKGHEVRILDLLLEEARGRLPPTRAVSGVLQTTLDGFEPDCVGITAFTPQYRQAKEVARAIKGAAPEIPIVMGGVHASALPEYVLDDCPQIDYVVVGEGEQTLERLLNAIGRNIPLGKVDGLVYREGDLVKRNPPRAIDDLDSLPHPWQVLNPLDYSTGKVHGFTYKRLPVTSIMTTRGCPYGCTYCGASIIHGKKIRVRSAENVLDEIELLIEEYGIAEIKISDDNFTFYRWHAASICQGIKERGLNFLWDLPNGIRVDRVDKELLQEMREAGCYSLAFGFEFGSDRILRLCKKPLDMERSIEVTRMAKDLGFHVKGFFMLGHPDETKADVLKTIQLMKGLPLDAAMLGPLVPFPGTELFNRYLNEGLLDFSEIDWNEFGVSSFVPRCRYLSPSSIKRLQIRAYLEFFASQGRIFHWLTGIRGLSQIEQALSWATTVLRR